ncbi:MAG: hypothetical protein IT541_12350, partial [Hyphomicrobiales bacterium]|nr:hypothetical protein [Hyphomicrobiales bacterium]
MMAASMTPRTRQNTCLSITLKIVPPPFGQEACRLLRIMGQSPGRRNVRPNSNRGRHGWTGAGAPPVRQIAQDDRVMALFIAARAAVDQAE